MDGYDIWLELLEKGIYTIYPDGTILKIRRNKGTGEKIEPKEEKNQGKDGYRVLGIKYKGKMHILAHHQIVWYTYRRIKPRKGQEIDHFDNNKTNNDIENLVLVTDRHNLAKSFLTGTMGRRGRRILMRKTNRDEVKEIRKLWKEGYTKPEIQRMLKLTISIPNIKKIIDRKIWKEGYTLQEMQEIMDRLLKAGQSS
jgi:hypothetical protein